MDRIGIGIGIGIGIYGWVGYSDERWDRIARRSVIEKKQTKMEENTLDTTDGWTDGWTESR